MKPYLSTIFTLFFAFSAFSQTPSLSPTPERPTLKTFGSSLKKYEENKKKDKNSKDSSLDTGNIAESREDETIRVKTELVTSDVLVVNEKGNIISGLKKDDFIITEDNALQTIEMFSPGENSSIPRSIVLIIDRSSSLFPYLKDSFDAAKVLIDKLGPNDRMAIVTDDVKLVAEFTSNKTLLKQSIEQLRQHRGGLSHQYSALLAVLKEMFDNEDIRPIVIVQSDGDEITSLRRDPMDLPMPIEMRNMLLKGEGERPYSYQELLEAVKKSRATIYSVIPGFRLLGYTEAKQLEQIGTHLKNWSDFLGSHNFGLKDRLKEQGGVIRQLFLARQNSMFEIANTSGGYTDFIEEPEDAEKVYSTIFTVIGNRYTLGYYPTNQEREGQRRNVKVEVRGHPEYIVTGRKTYLAQ